MIFKESETDEPIKRKVNLSKVTHNVLPVMSCEKARANSLSLTSYLSQGAKMSSIDVNNIISRLRKQILLFIFSKL